ncbi:hypothetical protein [Streptomyces melanogenes]|uniref:hypothetical protein n=1 Tax=Streptomyces melanogenes TaxID=67326 RepID=UPI00167D5ABC|nr:hypothetical protein [Streptomyces melanogenes]GGP90808.1 hypothetical protein GCM10010278_81430 [Streptomyces melanogenes]
MITRHTRVAHLLVLSPGPALPADAGRFYCIPRHQTPVLRYVSPLPPAEARPPAALRPASRTARPDAKR